MSPPSWDALLAASGLPRLEARVLLEHASGRPRSWLMAHGNEPAAAMAAGRFTELAARRRAGEPLAYLTGFREFHGLALQVSPAVLIPRADTELLVDLAIELAPPRGRLLDLGTGSGAVAIATAVRRPDLDVVATDLSDQALAIASANAQRCLAATGRGQADPARPIRFLAGSWWAALPPDEPPFQLIVSNPPYIAAGDPHLLRGDLPHEPAGALASGHDGLDAIRVISAEARAHLLPGGWLLLEHGFDQGPAVRGLLQEAGLARIATHRDAGGRERVTLGQSPLV